MDNKFEDFKEVVMEEYRKGNIVYMSIEGPMTRPITEFVKQPVDGILYDLNRLEEVILTYIEKEKWINDYALTKLVRYQDKRIKELEEQLKDK